LAQFAEEDKNFRLQKYYLEKIQTNANRGQELYKKSKKKLKNLPND